MFNTLLRKINSINKKMKFERFKRENNIYIAKGTYIESGCKIGKRTRINMASHLGFCEIGSDCATGGRLINRSSNHHTQYANMQNIFQKEFLNS